MIAISSAAARPPARPILRSVKESLPRRFMSSIMPYRPVVCTHRSGHNSVRGRVVFGTHQWIGKRPSKLHRGNFDCPPTQ